MAVDDAALERLRDDLLAALRDSEHRIRGEFAEAISASEVRLGSRIDASAAETRRHMGVVAEDLKSNIALVAEGEESWMDPEALRRVVLAKLKESSVTLHLGTRATPEMLAPFDAVILATYARLNELVPPELSSQDYQYEVCEKPVVRLQGLENTGIVVLDGPFMCADPWGKSGLHVLGNVVHAIHATNVGKAPIIPENLAALLDRGLIKNPSITKIKDFLESGARYIPLLANAEHIGSLFTIRTVLPRLEKTDARPTIVTRLSERYIRIFSGKIGNCVEAAKEVASLL